jgi:NAD(P)-dependent dehydrogenase (short-subunit alcohol dehydrogenase family)
MKKVILISGGSDGIGRATAARLRDQHTVVILSSNGPNLLRVAGELGISCIAGNVTDYAAMRRAVATVIERHGRLDVLINNAGLWIDGPLESNDPDRIKQVMDVNALGTINLTHAAIPALKKQRSGRIVNVISQAGLHAKAERSVYNASKWAITGFTQALQDELAAHHIGVTGLYPGKINTKLFEKAGSHKALDDALRVEQIAATLELIVNADPDVLVTEVGLKHLG